MIKAKNRKETISKDKKHQDKNNETHYFKKIGPIFKIHKPFKNMTVIEQEHKINQCLRMNETMQTKFELINKKTIMEQLQRQTNMKFKQVKDEQIQNVSVTSSFGNQSMQRYYIKPFNKTKKETNVFNQTNYSTKTVNISNQTMTNLSKIIRPKLEEDHQIIKGLENKKFSLEIIASNFENIDFENGLECNKNLFKFDCIEQEISDEQMFQITKNKPKPDAKSLGYFDHVYGWYDVDVLNYDSTSKKYTVKVIKTNEIKKVIRLGLVFNWEDQQKFFNRLNQAKNLMLNANDEARYLNFINKVNDNDVSILQNSVKQRINSKFSYTTYQKPLVNQLMKEVEDNYILQLKKCLVIKEMQKQVNFEKFHDQRIKIRKLKNLIPYFGTVKNVFGNYDYNFKNNKELIMKLHISNNKNIIKALKQFTIKSLPYEDFYIFDTKYLVTVFPMELGKFEIRQQNYIKTQASILHMQWREYLISEIQDILKNTFKFYQTDTEKYKSTELNKFIKRIDLMFNTFIRENIFKANLFKWYDYLRAFNNSYLLGQTFKSNEFALFQIYLCVNTNIQPEKKKGKKDDKTDKEQIFYFDPSIEKITEVLFIPLQKIQSISEQFIILEKDLVPLIDVEKKNAFLVETEKDLFIDYQQKVKEIIEIGFQKPIKILEDFQKFNFLIEKNSKLILKTCFGESKDRIIIDNLTMDTIKYELELLNQSKQNIQKLYINQTNCGFFLVQTKNCKEILFQKINETQNTILNKITDICIDNVYRIQESYENMLKNMKIYPKNEQELIELKQFIGKYRQDIKLNQDSISIIGQYIELLGDYNIEYNQQEQQIYWALRNWPQEIITAEADGKKGLQAQEYKFQDLLQAEKEKFVQELKNLTNKFQEIKKYNNYGNVKEYAIETSNLKDQIEQSQEKVKSFNEREALFKQQQSEYIALQDLIVDFEPYHKVWDLAIEFDMEKQDWYNGPFIKLNYNEIERKLKGFIRNATFLIKKFEQLQQDQVLEITNIFKEDLENFQEQSWIIKFLTIEVMIKKSFYWKELFQKCGLTPVDPNDDMTLKLLQEIGLPNYRTEIEELSKRVEKQYALEKKLNEMIENLKLIKIGTHKYKNTYLIDKIDDIITQIDDVCNNLVFMKSSPYIKPILKRTNDLEQKLLLVQDTLEGWMKCQRSWKYLEPIFGSDDIKKKMPMEHRKFEILDRQLRTINEHYQREPNLWDQIDGDKMKNDFDQSNKNLDQIQKSLQDYLETKRKWFPRFYFLSDEQLLEILAQSKDPLMVQKHVNKCFEAINLLIFNQNELVLGMISPEQEKVDFCDHIDVNDGEKKGHVEKWMLEIEIIMKKTLSLISQKALKDASPRTEWVLKYPAMIVLCGNMIQWTLMTETAIEKVDEQQDSIQLYKKYLNDQLNDIVKLVRGDMTELDRMTLGALVVLDVHNREIIDQLIQQNVDNVHEFIWISQLRYYQIFQKNKYQIDIKMINSTQQYGFEYLGNSTRLVITPLTDRCYRTLMGAYQMFYGGAPEGPAGTGKTETTKDLAKAIAMQCVVFNCSDQLNYQAMSKFFKGQASSGAWCCFDEFNRIDLEVLSVIAQQVITIQNAIKEKRKTFIFDGDDIVIIHTCSINITMNPGYAGRSELPDNLKVLFRTVAMMVPDYKLIAEIYLYSSGFKDAENLARKIVASLRLSSEQLSSQFHYDFGMRALKAILNAAGELRRKLDDSEDILALMVLQDVNLPKFTLNDIPLFKNITSDLFPGIEMPKKDESLLSESLIKACKINEWIPKQEFITKCIQLYDTIMVRHGLMIVGQSNSGKSAILECLKQAINLMEEDLGSPNKIFLNKINPKSIMILQLYGIFDMDTKSWSDGILPRIMRQNSNNYDQPHKYWICLDGPVDAVWIENMNTVLDDNKKLCLTSGEIIKLTPQMRMIFEVDDLQYASPATVSRCGMVFLETKNIGWQVAFQSYFISQFPVALQKVQEQTQELLGNILDCSIQFIRKHGSFPMQYSEISLIQNFIMIFKNFMSDFQGEEIKIPNWIEEYIQSSLIFGIIWSIGAALEETCRQQFHEFILKIMQGENIVEEYEIESSYEAFIWKIQINESMEQNIYSVCYVKSQKKWINWLQTEPQYQVPIGESMQELIIPTVDSIRNNYLLNLNIEMNNHMLLVGPTGTGKTVNVANELQRKYFNETSISMVTSFSGQTTCNQIQKQIEAKMNSKKRKGRFGPEDRKARMVLFIDDFNMPIKEKYGAQPPLEIIRQQLDVGGWYDLETKEQKFLEGLILVSAMGPPSQGRNPISLRCSRHFNLLYVEPYQPNSLQKIFSCLMEWFFLNTGKEMIQGIQKLQQKLVMSSIQMYNCIKSSKELLPTPAKCHYTYNLRDISKLFYGIGLVNHHGCKTEQQFIKLWIHECLRVFYDRLVNNYDQQIFYSYLKDILKSGFSYDYDDLIGNDNLMWSSILPYQEDEKSKKINGIYQDINDLDQLKVKCVDELNHYNAQNSSSRMDLVLFRNAIEHILRIQRMVNFPQGHGLLIGVGGSGRKSLAMLACYIGGYLVFQIDAKNWLEEMQKIIKQIGLDQKPSILFFSDTQAIKETFYEDISNLLNKGEIQSLFNLEERTKIVEEISNFMPIGTFNQKYNYFIQKCKENLHLLIFLSPVGESFRKVVRTFPSLVNCTTIDWFLPWPTEALISTAENVIKQCDIFETNKEETIQGVVNIFVDMHNEIINLTEKFYQEYRRYYYITPTSYLELLHIYKILHDSRSKSINDQILRYQNGLLRLESTEEQVSLMQEKLEKLKPILSEKNEQMSLMLVNLQKKQKEVNTQRELCQADEKICNIQQQEATDLKASCESDLQKVLPLLDDAQKALEKIKQEDITLIKSFTSPPPTLDLLMQSVIIALNEEKDVKWKNKDPNDPNKGKEQDFWEYAKRNILNNKLIKRIQQYKEEKIKMMNPKNIEKLKKICANPEYQKEKVFKVSEPAGNMSLWIRACVETYEALLIVEPKRQKLVDAEKSLAQAIENLRQKQADLHQVLQLLKELEDEYSQAIKEKNELEAQVETVATQLFRATQLIEGLGSEKISWNKKSQQYKENLTKITGDVVLCSGMIAYMGPFFMTQRDQSLEHWKVLLQEKQIIMTQNFQLSEVMSDANTIGIWVNQHKLPNDRFSIDNAIISKNSSKWSLIIDPQFQANIWIKGMSDTNLKVLRQNQSFQEIMFVLENSIQYGHTILLDNIAEDIDPIFEDVLQNKKIKQGNNYFLKMGEKTLDYHPDFRFFMTTKIANPHYPPEICVKVTLVNFMITMEGLEDQMLNIVIKIEEPSKDEMRQKNIKEFFENKTKQQQTEDLILKMLSEASGNILDDEDLINTLQTSKIESVEIEEKLKVQELNREQFKTLQNFYKDCAKRFSNLYFAIQDLSLIEPVYQFSLDFYVEIVQNSIEKTPQGRFEKVKNINNLFTINLYEQVVRSLLERDKLTFSLLLCQRILVYEKKIITIQELRFLMVGGTATSSKLENPCSSWLKEKQWSTICEMSDSLDAFKGIDQEFIENSDAWFQIYQSSEPYLITEVNWPQKWITNLNSFQRLILIRVLRPDKLIPAIQNMIVDQMDKNFIEQPFFDLNQVLEDSTNQKPLIFILSTGADPRSEVEYIAKRKDMSQKLIIRSMGQGQGDSVIAAIDDAKESGKWVYLQNCHLARSFMPKLEMIYENLSQGCHPEFRLWLTTAPFKEFPVTILQKGIKLTYEPPKGIKNSLKKSFNTYEWAQVEQSKHVSEFKRLLFGLSFFHALVLERRKFGPLGWNVRYEFSATDLQISFQQLGLFLNQYDNIQWTALNYLIAEANYGGRVTDDKDRRLIKILLKDFFNANAIKNDHKYSKSGIYFCPKDGPYENYKEYIMKLPLTEKPEIFGMHDNAEISASISQTNELCGVILGLLPRLGASTGVSPEEKIKQKCYEMLEKVPKEFDLEIASKKLPIMYQQSMNTVLQQELIRYNRMITTVHASLDQLRKAIDGLVSMTNDLDDLFNSIFDNKVPEQWHRVSYPSLKPMGSWINNLIQRINNFQKWIDEGQPSNFWISGFYFPQSFFTGVQQNFARKYKIPIDTLIFDFISVKKDRSNYDTEVSPDDGCYIYGLYLDAAKWNDDLQALDEQESKVLYYDMCSIYCMPIQEADLQVSNRYECPVYKVSTRRGTLSTTGHSTNFVLFIYLPLQPQHNYQHWIKRGVAMLTQLDD